jgi:hypothetical protein
LVSVLIWRTGPGQERYVLQLAIFAAALDAHALGAKLEALPEQA